MRIGLYPFPSSGDMSANLAHIRTGTALAAEQSVELLVFHECALCGYPPLETSMEAVTPERVSCKSGFMNTREASMSSKNAIPFSFT